MSRPYCNVCQRPQVSCICHLVNTTNNDIDVVILQHPSEVKQTKGTVTLLKQSLTSCQVFVGENFTEHVELRQMVDKYKNEIALLYPSEQAVDISKSQFVENIRCIILLDGTWKKAYRLYMMNPWLHELTHITLPDDIKGQYQIRSTKKKGALSSLEACCYTLALLEDSTQKYKNILTSFAQFNQMHLSFNPKSNKG